MPESGSLRTRRDDMNKTAFVIIVLICLCFNRAHGADGVHGDRRPVQEESLARETVTLYPSITYQTIEGLGGATAFYNNWITSHPYKQEIYEEAFAGLNLSMLRLGNWWRGVDGQDTDSYEIVAAAQTSLDHDIPIMISSWSPPATLKSNGEVGNGGTLVKVNGQYDYEGFADYWFDSLQDYMAYGVTPTWISIQNEPGWTASYDSCRFNPSEARWSGERYASYALALDAVYQRLQDDMATPPKLLGPEVLGGGYNLIQDFLEEMDSNSFYGIAHHLYHGSTDGTPDGYESAFDGVLDARDRLFPDKPIFMTEYGDFNDMIDCANLLHNSLAIEQVSAYNHWCLIWPGEIGLIEIEFPWSSGNWISEKGYWLNPSYWAMKHYSYFIEPGYVRVEAESSDTDLLISAYLSPDNHRLVAVIINRSTAISAGVTVQRGLFDYDYSYLYQSTSDSHFESLGSMQRSPITLPESSITTVVLDQGIALEQASNPTPVDEAIAVHCL